MAYKIQPLVEANYDFAKLYTDKQDAVRAATGLDFNLENIVKFLQRQTNNFTVDNPVAHDLDNAIYNIVTKHEQELGKTDEVKDEPLEKSEEETRQDIIEAIELLELLGEDADEETKEALEILKTLV
jgi:hypothetical protein